MTASRPPVLAHERFIADRDRFAGLDLAARFERIERTNLWGAAIDRLGPNSPPGWWSLPPADLKIAAQFDGYERSDLFAIKGRIVAVWSNRSCSRAK